MVMTPVAFSLRAFFSFAVHNSTVC